MRHSLENPAQVQELLRNSLSAATSVKKVYWATSKWNEMKWAHRSSSAIPIWTGLVSSNCRWRPTYQLRSNIIEFNVTQESQTPTSCKLKRILAKPERNLFKTSLLVSTSGHLKLSGLLVYLFIIRDGYIARVRRPRRINTSRGTISLTPRQEVTHVY